MTSRLLLTLPLLASLSACDNSPEFEQGADSQGHTAPSMVTAKANQAIIDQRPFSNTADFEDAKRGLIASDDSLITSKVDPRWTVKWCGTCRPMTSLNMKATTVAPPPV